jgi:hypothetical protein
MGFVKKAMLSSVHRVLVFALGLAFGADASLADSLVLDKSFPTHLEQVKVQIHDSAGLPVENAQLSVTYRPGSRVAQSDIIGKTSVDGSLNWTPAVAGIATLTATWNDRDKVEQTTSTNVSVRFRQLPLGGIFIMIAAGLILIVGSAIRMYRVIRSPEFVQ